MGQGQSDLSDQIFLQDQMCLIKGNGNSVTKNLSFRFSFGTA